MTLPASFSATTILVSALALFSCTRGDGTPAPAPAHTAVSPGQASKIAIAVTADGFVPAQTRVKVGQPVTLVVTRQVDRTCATEIVIKDYQINQPLPKDQPVEVTFTPTQPGSIRYACAMDMIAGELVAE